MGKVNIFRAEDQGEKDTSAFRDEYEERILSPGQSGEIRLVHIYIYISFF